MIFLGLEEYMFSCTNKKIFGVECIGCGAQRATAFLFKGDFTSAFKLYPAIFPIATLLFIVVFNLFVKFKFDLQLKLILIYISVGVALISYCIKMYPYI